MNHVGHRPIVGGLLGIHALTSLHAGSGAALGTVDLPIQREQQNSWPTIPGSALKGILRDAGREETIKAGKQPNRDSADSDPNILALFGASKKHANTLDESAGALAITDARLLAFPIRSLKGAFAWVTCAAALSRLSRDLMLVGRSERDIEIANPPSDFHAIVAADSPLLIDGKYLQLDDEPYTRIDTPPSSVGKWIGAALLPKLPEYASTTARLVKHLVVVSDSDFTHIAKYSTEVTARIGLNYETKTKKDGALFYQEFVPTEAIFYSVVLVNDSRLTNKDPANKKQPAMQLLKYFADRICASNMLQIGGDETTGKGLCAIRLWIGDKA